MSAFLYFQFGLNALSQGIVDMSGRELHILQVQPDADKARPSPKAIKAIVLLP